MAIKIKGISTNTENRHYFCDYHAFIDSDGDFFIICEFGHVVRMYDDFPEENVNDCDYDTIEDFLKKRYDTKLVRAFKKDDFDIEITVK